MFLFLALLFTLGFLHNAVNLSLQKKRSSAGIFALVLAAVGYALFPLAAKVNIQAVNQAMHDAKVLSLACTYQIIEALLIMLLAVGLIKSHYRNTRIAVLELPALFPSGIFLGGLFILQTYIFHVIHGMQFYLVALGFWLLILAVVGVLPLGLRKLFPRWEWRIEIKIMLSFFQILLAMFIPLLLVGTRCSGTRFQVDLPATLATLAALLLPVVLGYYMKIRAKGDKAIW